MTLLTLRDLFYLVRQGPDREAEGQGLVEYALLIFLIAVAAVTAVGAMGIGMKTKLYDVIVAAWPG